MLEKCKHRKSFWFIYKRKESSRDVFLQEMVLNLEDDFNYWPMLQ